MPHAIKNHAVLLRHLMRLLFVFLAIAGCQRPVTRSPAPAKPAEDDREAVANSQVKPAAELPEENAEDEAPESAAEVSDKDTEEVDTAEEKREGVSEADEAKSQDTSDREPPSDDVAESAPSADERFLLLTRDGPLVIDLILKIDGQPYDLALERVVDEAFSTANADGDGEATWEETLDNPAFSYGQFGNLIPEDESQRNQLIEMYDTNRNGLVDRDELPRFLTRNAGGSRPFSLQSSNEFRNENRSRSPVRQLLDADRNGAITKEEREAAPKRLIQRDADDDEILVLADMKETVEQTQPGQMSNRRRTNAPDNAILFSERLRWGYVAYALGETYAYGDRVGKADVPLVPQLVDGLDENGNDLIDSNEVAKLADVPPHLLLEVAFFNGEADRAGPRIRLVSAGDELQSAVGSLREHPARLSLDLPGAEVEFFVNEDPSLTNTVQTVNNQFAMLDADDNGYLDEEEFPSRLLGFDVAFAGVDVDENDMITEGEVKTFVVRRQAIMRSQIRARAADQEDALFTALDTDGDGRLTAREIEHAPQFLASLDVNEDGGVQSHEIPGAMAVGFVRGNVQQNNGLFNPPATVRRRAEGELPKWFRGMDTNADGDISSREFLGTPDQFSELDTDGDDFISSTEAQQYEADRQSEGE